MLIMCRGIVEPCHQLVKIHRESLAVATRQRGSTASLELTMEKVTQVNGHSVVTDVAETLSEQVGV